MLWHQFLAPPPLPPSTPHWLLCAAGFGAPPHTHDHLPVLSFSLLPVGDAHRVIQCHHIYFMCKSPPNAWQYCVRVCVLRQGWAGCQTPLDPHTLTHKNTALLWRATWSHAAHKAGAYKAASSATPTTRFERRSRCWWRWWRGLRSCTSATWSVAWWTQRPTPAACPPHTCPAKKHTKTGTYHASAPRPA